ncbi:primary-amine oxidase [Actinoplanes couchii]|uniref:Amine oxidase n=1 Tax=Actinoplanes couchii TaxID=403638 RepID=A0ABQ3XG42_9ACTN|nr:primary-amine oxidase [Actinoplanes couchii]MDR6320960.1 primary-amine oxidase [Actinoplanes couchii]GID57472.1 amine oxidase [Actinoplanes couchii]
MSVCHTTASPVLRSHPLDPPTTIEINLAVDAARTDGRLGERPRFWGATLDETHARKVVAGDATGVRLGLVAIATGGAAAWEIDVVVNGDKAEAVDWREVDPRRPGITSDEARAAAQACRDSELFREVMARRGIHDVSLVMIDAESMGGFEGKYAGRRVTWGTVWHRTEVEDNGYARPVQGVVPIIDMNTMEVLEVEDHGVIPVSEEAGLLTTGAFGPDREGLKPIDVVQPEGPSFSVDGWKVDWQGWTFRVGFTHREGLVLYDLEFQGRSILKRAACNEMYVPYLDSNSTQYRKNFFDWGEYGAGPLTNSLALGCDCLGVIYYFNGIHLGGYGDPVSIDNAICMHEEDASILWKHNDLRRGVSEVRRSRRLIISNFQTVANYDYGFYWTLYQDGRIELEVKLTGILSASGINEGEEAPYGRIVAKNVQTPIHQHYFGIRLDTAIDGELNRLVEEHAETEPDPALNPYGNAVRYVREPLTTETAQRNDPSIARHWRIESADKTNRYGEPTAYRLAIPNTTRSFGLPESVMARRAPFIHQHVWATPFDESEQFIGGQYPNHAEPGEDGVHVWQEQQRSIDGVPLVVWPVLGVHHLPRPEQWPVMPVEAIHLVLEPDGFFDRNPALDIPDPAASRGGSTCCS